MNQRIIFLNRSILFVAIVGVSLVLVGCTPKLVGENAAVYSMGRLHARVDSNMTSVYEASVSAFEKLEIQLTDKQKDVFGAKVTGKTSDNHPITISIKPESDTSATLTIRVGSIGAEERSHAIYEQIRKELGQTM